MRAWGVRNWFIAIGQEQAEEPRFGSEGRAGKRRRGAERVYPSINSNH